MLSHVGPPPLQQDIQLDPMVIYTSNIDYQSDSSRGNHSVQNKKECLKIYHGLQVGITGTGNIVANLEYSSALVHEDNLRLGIAVSRKTISEVEPILSTAPSRPITSASHILAGECHCDPEVEDIDAGVANLVEIKAGILRPRAEQDIMDEKAHRLATVRKIMKFQFKNSVKSYKKKQNGFFHHRNIRYCGIEVALNENEVLKDLEKIHGEAAGTYFQEA